MSLRVEKLLSDLRSAAEKATQPYACSCGKNVSCGEVEDFQRSISPENILVLVQALEEARELAEGCTNACIFDYPGEKEFVTSGICTCREKARAFLEKYFPKGET